MRAHAEVEQDAIGVKVDNGGKGGRGGKRGLEIIDALVTEAALGGRNCIRVTIDSQNPSPKPQEHGGVAAAAERRVDSAGGALRPLSHRRGKNRGVVVNRGV
jgi:hypothetical protein